MFKRLFPLIFIVFIFSSCNKEDSFSPCDQQIPIVAVHGFFGSGDSYEALFGRLQANGYCANKLYALDWNSLLGAEQIGVLENYIEEVLIENNATEVYLLGHSLGGALSYNALKKNRIANKVKKYVHLASFPQEQPAGPQGEISTLNIYSDADFVVEGDTMPNAVNFRYEVLDHFEVATSPEAFDNIYQFFFNEVPVTLDFDIKEKVSVSGKALSIIENWNAVNYTVEIYEVDPQTGFRLNESPDALVNTDHEGFWGPVELSGSKYYEYMVSNTNGNDVPIHYYREPVTYDNNMIYLRTYPKPNYLTYPIFNQVPRDDDFGVSIIFNVTKYITIGRDVLSINGFDLLEADGTTTLARDYVAILLFDGNDNQQSDLNTLGFVGDDNVIDAIDMYLDINSIPTVRHEYNNKVVNVKNWPSKSGGISVAIF